MTGKPLRLAYNTNGLAHHRLEDALDLLAAAGYDGVGLTLDANHLDPLRATPAEVAQVRSLLEKRRLACVVEHQAIARLPHWCLLDVADADIALTLAKEFQRHGLFVRGVPHRQNR